MTEYRRLRVLVADDMADFRMLLRVVLEQDGRFEVVGEARDGREAVKMTADEHPDVILLDLAMPVMDGLQAIPEIHEVSPETKIIVLSGFADDQMAQQALSLDASAFIEKGDELTVITTTVADVCGGGGGSAAAPRNTP